MNNKILKIPDNLTDDDHKLLSKKILSKNIDGISISYLGSNFGPVWSKEKSYNLEFLKYYKGINSIEIFLPKIIDLLPIEYLSESINFISIGEIESKSVSLKPISKLNKLKKLYICKNKKDFNSLSMLTQLEEIGLTGYSENELNIISNFKNLRKLYIGFGTATELPDFTNQKKLETLELLWIKKLNNISQIQSLKSLKTLKIANLKQVTEIPLLSELENLNYMLLDTMNGLISVDGLKGTNIRELAIINSKLSAGIFNEIEKSMNKLNKVLLGLKLKKNTNDAKSFFSNTEIVSNANDLTVWDLSNRFTYLDSIVKLG